VNGAAASNQSVNTLTSRVGLRVGLSGISDGLTVAMPRILWYAKASMIGDSQMERGIYEHEKNQQNE
jgi:hypothetical protein